MPTYLQSSRDLAQRLIAVLNMASMAKDPLRIAAAAGLHAYPWQVRILTSTTQTLLINCSRQAGKSTTTAMLIVEQLLQSERTIVIVTPSLRQSKELMRKVLGFWRKLGRPIAHVAATRTSLELVNESRLEAFPASSDTIRGISAVNLLVIDEAAMVDEEVYDAVTPMLAAVNGRLIALSTPHGKRGWWYELWKMGDPADELYDPEIERVEVPATEIPHLSAQFLAREKRRKPSTFDQEYLCKFLDDERAAFRTVDIDAAQQADIDVWDWCIKLEESAG